MSQISAFSSAQSGLGATGTNRFSDMKTEDFIRIIFTELSNQDPFSPNDSSALLDQLNSIRSIESDLRLTEQLQSLVFENQMSSAGNLIGKLVGGLTEDSQRVAGFVVSAIRQGDEITLELDNGWFVPLKNLETVLDPTILDDPANPPTDPPAGPPNNPTDPDT